MGFKKYFLWIGFATLLFACESSQSKNWIWRSDYSYSELLPFEESPFMFYNVENLFDTINDPNKMDDDFTPEGAKEWNSEKYFEKLHNLAEVLTAPSKNNPLFVGFAEVETKGVVSNLMQTGRLSTTKYEVVHFESPDVRGIDVSFAYDAQRFKVESVEKIPFFTDENPRIKTRNILYVKGGVKDSLILHIFVNHWPSRREGEKKSEYKRVAAAKILRHKTDSILATDKDAKILIMGDFNDYPPNISISKTLDAGMPNGNQSLINIMLPMHQQGIGSFRYDRQWGMLDQFIVTPNLVHTDSGLHIKDGIAHIVDNDKFLYFYNDGGKTPNKSYAGDKYLGGYSDHLAVYGYLEKR